ncbi:uncharacterized protein K02A2.6-like [Lytechinus variegatus]|uniref:uncharacterized protein K02A2.6-like n=1 Tax=Lytechinus variegatus TaxID=7654 RepID=UPI001BB23C87|nr:uncharacterized protein K02A2.6-like [Lytechinus variegatus]
MAVTQKKSGKVHVCQVPRPLNIVLKREHYPLPVLDDFYLSFQMLQSSICDLKDGYPHCKLDEESSLLTTFGTPWGRYRWKGLPFGLKVSSEIQFRLKEISFLGHVVSNSVLNPDPSKIEAILNMTDPAKMTSIACVAW